ncbi:MAG: hypothetical protein ACRD1T_00745 [Acidimicrobiia bacterium]
MGTDEPKSNDRSKSLAVAFLLLFLVSLAAAAGFGSRAREKSASVPAGEDMAETGPKFQVVADEAPPHREASSDTCLPDSAPGPPVKRLASTKELIALGVACYFPSGERQVRLLLVDVRTRELVAELARSHEDAIAYAWSTSGSRLLHAEFPASGPLIFRTTDFITGRTTETLRQSYSEEGGTFPAWLDDRSLVTAEKHEVVRLDRAGRRTLIRRHQEFGICRDGGGCPAPTGMTVSQDGLIAETFETGDVVFFTPNESSFTRTRSHGATCHDPRFRPGGDRLGLTCAQIPDGYDPASTDSTRNHYEVNAWVIDVRSGRWFRVQTGDGGHEWGMDYFPWSPDARRYVVGTFSEACASFHLTDSATGDKVSREYAGDFGSFSADGKSFVFTRYGSSDVCVSETNSVVVTMADWAERPLWGNSRSPLWSPAR